MFALFFSPLIAMIGEYPPITTPALTIVGAMMMQNLSKIEWKDYTESIPAFLIIIAIPPSYSIADGLALGFISYAIKIKGFSGRGREISWLTYTLPLVLVLYFVFGAQPNVATALCHRAAQATVLVRLDTARRLQHL